MTARAACHAIVSRPTHGTRARRRGRAAAASRPSWADRANAARPRRRTTARAKAAPRAQRGPRACERTTLRSTHSQADLRRDWLRISCASLTAIAPTTSTPAISTAHNAAVRHGKAPRRNERRGAAELAARAERRERHDAAGGSSGDHTEANVASGPACSANVPAASRYGAPPRAATRRHSCGNSSTSSARSPRSGADGSTRQ